MPSSAVKPVAAVSICVVRHQEVLLVKRAKKRSFGLWSLPGGSVELGEPLRDAALRELREETGISAQLTRLIDCVDVIEKSAAGEVTSHYILTVFGARWQSGTATAGDDASDVVWRRPDNLNDLPMTAGTAQLIQQVFPSLAAE